MRKRVGGGGGGFSWRSWILAYLQTKYMFGKKRVAWKRHIQKTQDTKHKLNLNILLYVELTRSLSTEAKWKAETRMKIEKLCSALLWQGRDFPLSVFRKIQ